MIIVTEQADVPPETTAYNNVGTKIITYSCSMSDDCAWCGTKVNGACRTLLSDMQAFFAGKISLLKPTLHKNIWQLIMIYIHYINSSIVAPSLSRIVTPNILWITVLHLERSVAWWCVWCTVISKYSVTWSDQRLGLQLQIQR